MSRKNSIKIERHIDGMSVRGFARYSEAEDGWHCSVFSNGTMTDRRGR